MSKDERINVPYLLFTSVKTAQKSGQQITSISSRGIDEATKLHILRYSYGVNPFGMVYCRVPITDTILSYKLKDNRVAIGQVIDAGRNYDGRPGRTLTHTIVLTEEQYNLIGNNPLVLHYLKDVFTRNDFLDKDMIDIEISEISKISQFTSNDFETIKTKLNLNLVKVVITYLLEGKNIVILTGDTQPLAEINSFLKVLPKYIRGLIRIATFFFDPFIQTATYSSLDVSEFNLIFAPRSCIKKPASIPINTIIIGGKGELIDGESIPTNDLATTLTNFISELKVQELNDYTKSFDKILKEYVGKLSHAQFLLKAKEIAFILENRVVCEKYLEEAIRLKTQSSYDKLFDKITLYRRTITEKNYIDQFSWAFEFERKSIQNALNAGLLDNIVKLKNHLIHYIRSSSAMNVDQNQQFITLSDIANWSVFSKANTFDKLSDIYLELLSMEQIHSDNRSKILELVLDKIKDLRLDISTKTNRILDSLKISPNLAIFEIIVDLIFYSGDFSFISKQYQQLIELTNIQTYEKHRESIMVKAIKASFKILDLPLAQLQNFLKVIFQNYFYNVFVSSPNSRRDFTSFISNFEGEQYSRIMNEIAEISYILFDKEIESKVAITQICDLLFILASVYPNKVKALEIQLKALSYRINTLSRNEITEQINEIKNKISTENVPILLEFGSKIFLDKDYNILKQYNSLLYHIKETQSLDRETSNSLNEYLNNLNREIFWKLFGKQLTPEELEFYMEEVIKLRLSYVFNQNTFEKFVEDLQKKEYFGRSPFINYYVICQQIFSSILKDEHSDKIYVINFADFISRLLDTYSQDFNSYLNSEKNQNRLANFLIYSIEAVKIIDSKYDSPRSNNARANIINNILNILSDATSDSNTIKNTNLEKLLVVTFRETSLDKFLKKNFDNVKKFIDKTNSFIASIFYENYLLAPAPGTKIDVNSYVVILDYFLKFAVKEDYDNFKQLSSLINRLTGISNLVPSESLLKISNESLKISRTNYSLERLEYLLNLWKNTNNLLDPDKNESKIVKGAYSLQKNIYDNLEHIFENVSKSQRQTRHVSDVYTKIVNDDSMKIKISQLLSEIFIYQTKSFLKFSKNFLDVLLINKNAADITMLYYQRAFSWLTKKKRDEGYYRIFDEFIENYIDMAIKLTKDDKWKHKKKAISQVDKLNEKWQLLSKRGASFR
ncbi:MAG: hypothetical protein GNW80_01695 [Asgard group archaeon]|nr:hypothetical protein [Asgard group archaeon]